MAKVTVAGLGHKVFKQECQFTFDNPLSEKGIFVNLGNLQSFGYDAVALDHRRTGNRIYLNLKHKKVKKDPAHVSDVTKLAIAVDGGFQTEEQQYVCPCILFAPECAHRSAY